MTVLNWLKSCFESEPLQSIPKEKEVWTVVYYEPYKDISYGLNTPSVMYEAVSTRMNRKSCYIYQSKMTKSTIEDFLNAGKTVGKECSY